MTLPTLLFILVFLIGLFFYAKSSNSKYKETFTNNSSGQIRCPNLLIQKGSRFYLYNSKVAKVPGVNPSTAEPLTRRLSKNASVPGKLRLKTIL